MIIMFAGWVEGLQGVSGGDLWLMRTAAVTFSWYSGPIFSVLATLGNHGHVTVTSDGGPISLSPIDKAVFVRGRVSGGCLVAGRYHTLRWGG